MNTKQLIIDRYGGALRVYIVSDGLRGLQYVLSHLNLIVVSEKKLQKVTPDIAVDILEYIIGHQLAYDTEMMPRDTARNYAREFVNEYYTEESIIYTNIDWSNSSIGRIAYTIQLTASIFDGGIIITNKDYAVCLWVEDND